MIDASRGGTTVEAWIPADVLRRLESAPVQDKLAEWDERVAEWDPQANLEPGPIADANYPGSCYAGMIGPLVGFPVKGALFHQGYNNALDGMRGVRLYRALFPVLIRA